MTTIALGRITTGPLTAVSTPKLTPVPESTLDLSMALVGNGVFVIEETGGVNSVTVNADGSNDGLAWVPAVATITIAPGTVGGLSISAADFGRYARLSLVNGNSGGSGTIAATGYAQ